MVVFTAFILFFAGILIALIAVMVGIGGGLLIVPFLIFVMGVEPNLATLVSTFTILGSSISAYSKYRAQGKVDHKTFFNFIVLIIIGSLIGGFAAEQVNAKLLKQIFGIFVLLSAIRGILKIYLNRNSVITKESIELDINDPNYRKLVDDSGNEFEYMVKLGIGKYFALAGGFVAGLLGVGGGIIFVPLLTSVSGIPIAIAAPTSITMIMITSSIALITRLLLKSNTGFDYGEYFNLAIPLTAGAVIGARLGPKYVKKINSVQLITLFWIIALFAGLRMLFS